MPDAATLADLAVRAARSAGDVLLEYARRPAVGVATKSSSTDMVSEADRAAERHILEILTRERPDDAVLGEEGASRTGSTGLRWVIDPLDGTTNFLYGFPQWAVSVACEDASGTLAGCVYDPNRGETFAATRGGGATLDGRPIRVSSQADLGQALVGTGFYYDARVRARQAAALARFLDRIRDVRRAGAAALDLAWTACGRLDAFFEAGLQPWDAAAGVLLIEEAGGVVTMGPSEHGPTGIVAAGPALHTELAALVAPG